VEVIRAGDSACVASVESSGDFQDREIRCLTGRDLSEFDYISIGHGSFVPVSVRPMIMTHLEHVNAHDDKKGR
jgi:hypothetical protein